MRTTIAHEHHRDVSHGIGRALHEIAHMVHVWQERAQARRQLAELDDHLLRDIGVDRDSLRHEIDKPFWRA